MKRILITGLNSYIGNSFEKWIEHYQDKYFIDKISLRDGEWKAKSFEGYDVVLHAAAIVHVKENDPDKYTKINEKLSIQVAEKAKASGVKQFIFLSTMGVYGTETGTISLNTVPDPKTLYAKSKLRAEEHLRNLETSSFKMAILRPPLVYGSKTKGNYPKLANMALRLPMFPKVKNKRSMIFIDNLSEFLRLTIDHQLNGIYFPQNKDYVNTSQLVKLIAAAHDKNIKETQLLNWVIKIGLKFSSTIRKVFGSFVYEKKMPGGPETIINGQVIDYETVPFEDSIILSEKM